MRALLALVSSLLLVYSLTSFGGVRSPDEEIQFRTAESLAFSGSWAVEHDLRSWPGFGLAQGLDNKRYSIFGPLEPFVLSGWLRLVEPLSTLIAQSFPGLPPDSYYPGSSSGESARSPAYNQLANARRFTASFFQCGLTAVAVGLFFLLGVQLTGSGSAAMFAALGLGLGSPYWAYSGMFFSEVLALLLLNGALLFLTKGRWLGAGLLLGLGIAAHITMLLWVPFLFPLLLLTWTRKSERIAETAWMPRAVALTSGILFSLAPLAWLNYERFGDIFETGRRLGSDLARRFGYGEFIIPDHSLVGLMLGAGKGLLLFSPIVLLALLCWRPMHRAFPLMSKALLAMFAARVLFIAARSDWHGGFCLGPRYLLLALPAILLALAFWYRDRPSRRGIGVALLTLAIVQQAFLANVEVFSMYRDSLAALDAQGIDAFAGDRLYLDWQFSPLSIGWSYGPSSWLAAFRGWSMFSTSAIFAALGAGAALVLMRVAKNR